MCLILFIHLPQRLVVAANRDEVYDRPTKAVHRWGSQHEQASTAVTILAGKDLEAGGTWMGISTPNNNDKSNSKDGRFAAVTNFREPRLDDQEAEARPDHAVRKSRGDLVSDFLTSDVSAKEYLEGILKDESCYYSGFNLLVGDANEGLYFCSNRSNDGSGNTLIEGVIQKLESGKVYGLCNRFLDYPWPKVMRAKQQFSDILVSTIAKGTWDAEKEHAIRAQLMELLKDTVKAPDKDNPHKETGCSFEFENLVSSIFIESDWYGTRACSVLIVDNNQQKNSFVERSFGVHGEFLGEVHKTWA